MAVLGPDQGGPGHPVVVQPPPVFLGTRPNYDALSAVLMDCNICVRPTSVYCLYYPLMSDHELIDLSYYVYLDI